MAYEPINRNEILNRFLSNPSAAIAQQLHIPADATSAVTNKRMLGIFDRMDQIQFSSEFVSAINYMAEHDPIAFFIFIKRPELVREMFGNQELDEKLLAQLEKLEREIEEEQYQQTLQADLQTQANLTKQQQAKIEQEREQKLKEERALANMELYAYYSHLQRELYENFYKKQNAALDDAYTIRMGMIQQAVNIAANDPTIAPEDRRRLEEIQESYKTEYEAAELIQVFNKDGTLNQLETSRSRFEAKQKIDENAHKNLTTVLGKYPEHAAFKALKKEADATHEMTKEVLAKNVVELREGLRKIQPHVEYLEKVAKGDIEEAMDETISCVKKCNMELLSEQQKIVFKDSRKRLQEFRGALGQAHDDNEVRDITSKFLSEVRKIKDIAKPPALSQENCIELDKKINLLSQSQNFLSSQKAASLLVEPHLQMVTEPLKQDVVRQIAQKEAVLQEVALQEVALQEVALQEVALQEVALQEVALQEVALQEVALQEVALQEVALQEVALQEVALQEVALQEVVPMQEPPSKAPAVSIAASMRQSLFHHRELHNNGQAKKEELSADKQDLLEETLKEIVAHESDIRDGSGFQDEDSAKKLKDLCEEILPTVREKVDVAKLTFLNKVLETLKTSHPEFSDAADRLETIIEPSGSTLSHS